MTVVCLASCNKDGDSGSSEAGEKQKIQSALHEAMVLMTGEAGEPVTSAILSKMKAGRESKGIFDSFSNYKLFIAQDNCFNAGEKVHIKNPEAQLTANGLDAIPYLTFQIVSVIPYYQSVLYIAKSNEVKSSVQEANILSDKAIPISLKEILKSDLKRLFITCELSNLLAGNKSLVKGVDNIGEGGGECQHLCLTVEDGTPKLAGILNQCGSAEGISTENNEDEIVLTTKSGKIMNFKSFFVIIKRIFSN